MGAPNSDAAPRVIALEGASNFRDLGGYRTLDGRTLKWRRLFRSNRLNLLTDQDYATLSPLGIRVVCDLRRPEERENDPTRWRSEPTPTFIALAQGSVKNEAREALAQAVASLAPRPETIRSLMIMLYRRLAHEYSGHVRAIVDKVMAEETPLLFHCTAGKDRTGIAAALLLSALDVPRDVILEDYALTERLINYEHEMQRESAVRSVLLNSWFGHLTPEARAPVFRADPSYLESMFEAIDQSHGSIDDFLSEEIGLDATTRTRLADRLLD